MVFQSTFNPLAPELLFFFLISAHPVYFERKVYRRILGPVYDKGKENCRILTNEEIYANIKKTYYNRDNKDA